MGDLGALHSVPTPPRGRQGRTGGQLFSPSVEPVRHTVPETEGMTHGCAFHTSLMAGRGQGDRGPLMWSSLTRSLTGCNFRNIGDILMLQKRKRNPKCVAGDYKFR